MSENLERRAIAHADGNEASQSGSAPVPRVPLAMRRPDVLPHFCCWVLQHIASSFEFPIVYDAAGKEFRCDGANGAVCILRYCPFCGHTLAVDEEDRRAEITKSEMEAILELTLEFDSIGAVYQKLGPPDYIKEAQCSSCARLDPWIRSHEYRSQWSMARLSIHEYADGSFRCVVSGKSGSDN